MSYDPKKFGERLAEARKRARMTQSDLGAKLDVSLNTVSSWEKGTTSIEFKRVVSLAKLLGISIDWLVGLSDDQGAVDESVRQSVLDVLDALRSDPIATATTLRKHLAGTQEEIDKGEGLQPVKPTRKPRNQNFLR